MAETKRTLPVWEPGRQRRWRALQALGLVAALALVILCRTAPELALRVLWGGVVPALPALWMLHPGLWRNVCPLATLELLGDAARGRTLSRVGSVRWPLVGMGLFALLVPARRLLFDQNAGAVGIALAAFAGLAFIRGRRHAVKAGFCNTLCPMGAAERLYGQRPLVEVSNARCATCMACTARGCLDLTQRKALPQLLGRARRGWRWLLRPHGVVVAGMPGFVAGYAWVSPGAGPWEALGLPLLGAAVGWTTALASVRLASVTSEDVLPWMAAASALAFYWWVAPAGVARWGVDVLPVAVRTLGTALVAVWTLRAGLWPVGEVVLRRLRPPRFLRPTA